MWELIIRILVIGGDGFIGTPLTRQLIEAGHGVIVFHRDRDGCEPAASHLHGDRNRLLEYLVKFQEFSRRGLRHETQWSGRFPAHRAVTDGRGMRPGAIVAKDTSMHQVQKEFGTVNPNAPAALSRFSFLVGRWRCEAKVRSADGEWQTFQATWVGRYVLDGYAIADEYRMTDSSRKLIVLGMNFRTYDAAKRTWNIKWLNALAGTWTDLAPSELGGVQFDGQSIIYAFREPVAGHTYTRATYTDISETHFTWRGEKSNDGKAWSEFMVVDCYRSKEQQHPHASSI